MLKVEWRRVGRFYEVKVAIENSIKLEMPGLLSLEEIRELASDLKTAAEDIANLAAGG